MVASDLMDCAGEGYLLTPIRLGDHARTLVEIEVRLTTGRLIGLIAQDDPHDFDFSRRLVHYYGVTTDCERVPGSYARLLDACVALRSFCDHALTT